MGKKSDGTTTDFYTLTVDRDSWEKSKKVWYFPDKRRFVVLNIDGKDHVSMQWMTGNMINVRDCVGVLDPIILEPGTYSVEELPILRYYSLAEELGEGTSIIEIQNKYEEYVEPTTLDRATHRWVSEVSLYGFTTISIAGDAVRFWPNLGWQEGEPREGIQAAEQTVSREVFRKENAEILIATEFINDMFVAFDMKLIASPDSQICVVHKGEVSQS